MNTSQAQQELDQIVEEIERDGFVTLDSEDLPCLLKALKALANFHDPSDR